MKKIPAMTSRELGAFFLSPIAYMVLVGMVAVSALNFWDLTTQLSDLRIETAGEASPMVRYVAYNLWFWLSMLAIIPMITMRLLAEEKRSGTIEVLMTAPVTESEVVLSKYLAALMFYTIIWVPSVIFLVVLYHYADFHFDWWPVSAVYVGVISVGAMFLSVGLFCSSLTRNQIIAGMITFAVVLLLFATFVMQFYAERSTQYNAWSEPLKYMAVLLHLYDFGTGKMDIKYLLFHLSVVIFMLFLTVKIVEVRKWR